MLNLIIRWVLSDLKVEAQLNIEDAELMQMGFSYSEAQKMTVRQRQQSMRARKLVADYNRMESRRDKIDIAVLTGGFSEKKSRKAITARWDSEVRDYTRAMAEYNIETPASFAGRGGKSKPTRNFKDVLATVKRNVEQIDNRPEGNESTGEALPAKA